MLDTLSHRTRGHNTLHVLKVMTGIGGVGGGCKGVGGVCGFLWKDKKVSQGRFASHDGSREEKRER